MTFGRMSAIVASVSPKILNKDKTCSHEGCPNPARARDMCAKHYKSWRKDPANSEVPLRVPYAKGTMCSITNCPDPVLARGWCTNHYAAWGRHGDPLWKPPERPKVCKLDGCDRPIYGHDLCNRDWQRWYKHGDPLWEPPTDVERFWSRVTKSDGCWEWDNLPLDGQRPLFSHNSASKGGASSCVKYAWNLAGGEPLNGRHIWLTCENEACVRFEHMEAITAAEGNRRRADRITECPQGHPYNERNTRIANGSRVCRICILARVRLRQSTVLDGDLIYINDIFDRDGGICQLCHEPVDPELVWPDPGSRSMDHIVPISPRDPTVAPGAHTLDNVQLTHLFCNCSKNNRSDLPSKSLAAA